MASVVLSGLYQNDLQRGRLFQALADLKRWVVGFPSVAYVLTHPHTTTRTVVVPGVPWAPSALDVHFQHLQAFPEGLDWRAGAESIEEISIA